MWVVGVVWAVRARAGSGHALAALKDSPNTYKKGLGMLPVGVVWAVRARGGSGHALAAVNLSRNTYKRVGVGGEGVGGSGHAVAALKYCINTKTL